MFLLFQLRKKKIVLANRLKHEVRDSNEEAFQTPFTSIKK